MDSTSNGTTAPAAEAAKAKETKADAVPAVIMEESVYNINNNDDDDINGDTTTESVGTTTTTAGEVSNREMPSMISVTDSVPPPKMSVSIDDGTNHTSVTSVATTATTTVPIKDHKKEKKEKKEKKKSHKHSVSTNIPVIPAASEKISDGDENNEDEDDGRIRLGICAMDKKARSKPMAEILSRLDEESFHVVFFGDDCIVNKPVEEWPICHVLIAFYSRGYPLEKALEYVELRKPFTLNDLRMQTLLKDRRRVYDLLQGSGIDVPRHVYLSRDDYVSSGTGDGNGARDQEVVEFDDHIEVKMT